MLEGKPCTIPFRDLTADIINLNSLCKAFKTFYEFCAFWTSERKSGYLSSKSFDDPLFPGVQLDLVENTGVWSIRE